MDIKQITNWDTNVEDYLKGIGEMSQIYSILHKKSEKIYSKIAYSIDIPTIIISTIAGTLSISSSGLFAGNEKMASVFIGVLSLSSSILTTINSYFNFSRRSENHRLVSIQYQRLYLKLDLILGLKPDERPVITEFIRYITDEYNRLAEISPIIDTSVIEDFKKRFSVYKGEITFPNECNGLMPINIYESRPKLLKRLIEISKNEDNKQKRRKPSFDDNLEEVIEEKEDKENIIIEGAENV